MAAEPTNRAGFVTVEIYDQLYHLAGNNAPHIQELARQVQEVRENQAARQRLDELVRQEREATRAA